MKKNELIKLIEPKIYNLISNDDVSIIDRSMHLTNNRFDLVFKIIYLEGLKGINSNFHYECYKSHIACFTKGTFLEDGNEHKNSIEKYTDCFKKLSDSIQSLGFDSEKSIVPLAKDGTILNGAHRAASSIFFESPIRCLMTDLEPNKYNYKFFENSGMPQEMMDFAAQKFIEYSNDSYLVLIWPSANISDIEIENIFGKIVYRKEISLNFLGANNLIAEAYKGATWLIDDATDISGCEVKQAKCFESNRPVRIFIFQCDNLEKVLNIKNEIRTKCGIGKHSVHITDNKKEAIDLSRVVLNNNSIHALNYAKNWKSCKSIVSKYRAFLSENNFNLENYLIVSSTVLDKYGLRSAGDLDYLTLSNSLLTDLFDEHEKEIEFHGVKKIELLTNPKYFFWCDGVKYLSIEQLKKMKKNRKTAKDIIDINLIDKYIYKDRRSSIVSVKYKILYFNMKIKHNILHQIKVILKEIGLFDEIKSIYIKFNK